MAMTTDAELRMCAKSSGSSCAFAVTSISHMTACASDSAFLKPRSIALVSPLRYCVWKPGVSRNTNCTSPRVKMPAMFCRVVCGLRDVMLIFCPTSALSSVDLPALGRPTIATKPPRCSIWLIKRWLVRKPVAQPPVQHGGDWCRCRYSVYSTVRQHTPLEIADHELRHEWRLQCRPAKADAVPATTPAAGFSRPCRKSPDEWFPERA